MEKRSFLIPKHLSKNIKKKFAVVPARRSLGTTPGFLRPLFVSEYRAADRNLRIAIWGGYTTLFRTPNFIGTKNSSHTHRDRYRALDLGTQLF
jgi:hypothetical protein